MLLKFARTALTSLAVLAACASTANAASVTLTWNDSGWYNSSGDHDSTNKNYIAGIGDFYRNYFVFDRSGVSGTITGATLRLTIPGTPDPDGISSAGNYSLFDVSTAIADLKADQSGLTGVYDDLGTGTSYGSSFYDGSESGTTTDIVLNAGALTGLNAVSSLFALGGSFDGDGFIFGFTSDDPKYLRQLILTTSDNATPEPGTIALIGLALVGLAATTRQRKAV